MAKSKPNNLEFEKIKCFVAYDATSGEVLCVHEVMSESGYSKPGDSVTDSEAIRKLASRDFEKRSIKVLELHKDFELKQDTAHWVDPHCGEIQELSAPVKSFREFVRQVKSVQVITD
jgi:hypothetical protein